MSSRAPNAPPTPPSDEPHPLLRADRGRRRSACGPRAATAWRCAARRRGRRRRGWPARPRGRGTPGPACRSRTCPRRRRRPMASASPQRIALVAQDVAVGMDRRVAAVDRRLRVEQRFEHLVLDVDGGQRPPARLRVVGGDGGDRLADVAHDVAGEHRLVGGDQPVRRLAGHVVGGDHRRDAGDRQRRATRRSTRCGRTGAASAASRPTPRRRSAGRTRRRTLPWALTIPSGPRPASRRSPPVADAGSRVPVSVTRHRSCPPASTATCCTASMIRP